METRLTSWDTINLLAAKAGITPRLAKSILQAQAELAYEHAPQGYPIAGIGVLLVFERPASTSVVPFGRDAGKPMTRPARKQLKFMVARAANEAIRENRPAAADATAVDLAPENP